MDIIVCVKHVPDTTEAEIAIRDDEKGIKKEGLVFDINEADNYAIEEALLLKEEFDGAITVLTVGPPEADETLRMCLAKGADKAVRLTDERFEGSDGFATARILSEAIKDMDYDLVLTGVQADDDGSAQVGVTLAEMLDIPHAALVVSTELEDGKMKVHRELEGGLHEVLEIELPALLTIQTGINEPRYASIFGIRKAMKKEIETLDLEDLGLTEGAVGEAGSKTSLVKLFIPVVTAQATILEGSPEEVSSELATILKNEGVV
ncbi:MAG: electron transfer flavoprotein subunit beta/FixA family protein [Anaerolineales bacterium]|nr:electron transfer flavoprotein subunit beta/FixA family protein [Anaerolineales bacterium]